MDIKDLNKSQMILLTILLSFVTSIATGIMTVSLMQQAPQSVTHNINRVIQQTIEKTIPGSTTKMQTVVVKEDDLVVDTVNKTRMSLAQISPSPKETGGALLGSAYSLGNGLFLSAFSGAAPDRTYTLAFGKNTYTAKVIGVSPLGPVILDTGTKTDGTAEFPKSNIALADPKVGQTLIAVSTMRIGKGVLQSVEINETEIDGKKVQSGALMLDGGPDISYAGSPLVDLDGNVVGIVVPSDTASAHVLDIQSLKDFLK